MKWFKHYSNAHNDNALKKVRMKYGAEGYAIYWYCLELIAADLDGENAKFELSHDAEVIGYDLKIDQVRVEEIMRYMVDLKLFEASNEKITCLKIAKFLDKKATRNKDIIDIIEAFNKDQDVSGNVGDKSKLSVDVADKSRRLALDEIRLDNKNTIRTTSSASDTPDCPHQAIIDLYHKHLPMMTKIKIWNDQRQSILKTRWREDPKRQNLDWWEGFFKYIAGIDFLCGRSGDWQADLEWIIRPKNFVKIVEGKYENREATV